MPEKKHLGPDEHAELNSEGSSQFKKRSHEDNPVASLGASVTTGGRKKLKTDGSSWNTGVSGGSRASENIRASGRWNLMIRRTMSGEYGVVNDFDLTSIMTPGQATPTKQGFERTGTKSFMAILLLEVKPPRVIQRRCAHDLESVIWCLAWYVLLGVVDWQEGTYRQVGSMKRTWVAHVNPHELPEHYRAGTEHLWAPLTNAAFEWNIRQDRVQKRSSAYSDKTNMELICSCLPFPQQPDGEEEGWMDFKVKAEDIKKEDRVLV